MRDPPPGYDAEPLSRIVTDQTPGPQYESELAPGGFQTLQTDAGRGEPQDADITPAAAPVCSIRGPLRKVHRGRRRRDWNAPRG